MESLFEKIIQEVYSISIGKREKNIQIDFNFVS